ncbi:BTAD domain-containing putative transcriptional regulator [Actinoplanes sp. NPDC049596]|uniref:AfsR/SARP family transcriptional regulator n=1 Tax=unclassified Actinoplanes TaxID=2626549 RepID=UPI003449D716
MSGDESRPEVRILGLVEVLRPDNEKVELQLQCRKVLALLITAAGRPVSTGQLVRSVWGEHTRSHAPQMVRSHIRVLRGALRDGAGRILTTGPAGYRMPPGGCAVDADRFRELLGEARRRLPRDAAGATRSARAALEMWRGPEAMPDVADVRPLRAEAAYLEELRWQAEETAVLGGLLSGRAEHVLPAARRLTELQPERERFWLQLMVAEALSGRLVEATSITFWRARRHLVEETGLYATGLDTLQRELLTGVVPPGRLLGLITPSDRSIA